MGQSPIRHHGGYFWHQAGDVTRSLGEEARVFASRRLSVAGVRELKRSPEVYVAPFPWTGAKWQVSTSGGDVPRWRHDGKELFFLPEGENQFMAAEVDGSGSSFEVGAVHPLFRANVSGFGWLYDVSHDGQRLIVVTAGEDSSPPLTLVENWTAELKKK
jgi:hypothetical protein